MSNTRSPALCKAVSEALWGMVIADAISMPVHWFYEVEQIEAKYGGIIKDYREPCAVHPRAYMGVSDIVEKSKPNQPVIGRVINHDKLQYWTTGSTDTHYHRGMAAGDSTLHCLEALVILQALQDKDPEGLSQNARLLRGHAMAARVEFMTTPGTHNDTFAEGSLREFFTMWASETPPPKEAASLVDFSEKFSAAAMAKTSDPLNGVSCLFQAVPWILHYAHRDEDTCVQLAVEWCRLVFPFDKNEVSVRAFGLLLYRLLHGADPAQEATNALETLNMFDLVEPLLAAATSAKTPEDALKAYRIGVAKLGLACALPGPFAASLFIILGHAKDFSGGVLMNANCGGDNCGRSVTVGACLGARMGTLDGGRIDSKWKTGVHSAKPMLTKLGMEVEKG